jgi:hypothetical protein
VAERAQPDPPTVALSERPHASSRPRRNLPPVTAAPRSSRGTLTYRDEDDPRPSIRIDGLSDDGWVRGRSVDGPAIAPYGPERSRPDSRARGPWRVAMCWDGVRLAPCLVPRQAVTGPRSSEWARRRAALAWRGSAGEEDAPRWDE